MRNAFKSLVGKPKGKRLLGRPNRKSKDSIKMDLKYAVKVWTRFNWIRIRSSGRVLYI
jgi:hypothetical protein